MIRSARTFFVLFLSLILIAAGAETKKKPGTSQSRKTTPKPAVTPKATPAAKSTPKTASSPKPSTSKKKGTPKSTAGDEKSPELSPFKNSDATPSPSPSPSPRKTSSKAKASPTPAPPSEPEPESVESTTTEGARGMLGPTVASIAPEALAELSQQPDWVQQLIRDALNLSTQNLGYLFGSSDPKAGGMDCSGTIYYILREHGFKDVPRDSRGQYAWLAEKGTLRKVADAEMADFDFRALRPGDLLFWTGTYQVNNGGALPISHVMLYLGIEKDTKKPVMWGASDGRTYGGKQRFGVSVFDFKLPRVESKSRFVGFGQLPTPGKR